MALRFEPATADVLTKTARFRAEANPQRGEGVEVDSIPLKFEGVSRRLSEQESIARIEHVRLVIIVAAG